MTYYLLKDSENQYCLFDCTSEVFFNEGNWTASPPIGKQLDTATQETVSYKNSKIINWWHPNHYEYVDATLVYRCQSLESYHLWCKKHPELFI